MNIVALIPARGGSKGIPRKNIKNYAGKPLIAHSIELAKNISLINEIIVSTDDLEIANIAKNYGATVPFIRPFKYAQDESTDSQVFFHYINWLTENGKNIPDLIVHLRPTYPNRNIKNVENMIEIMIKEQSFDSLRTVIPAPYSPFKTYWLRDNNLEPLFKITENGIKEPYNIGRQYLEKGYVHNGYVDIIRTSSMISKNSITGDKIYPYIMDSTCVNDIDTLEDWKNSEKSY